MPRRVGHRPVSPDVHPQHSPLLLPSHRQVLAQLLQTEAIGFIAAQNRLDDVRRKAGQAEHAADVGAVAADGVGQVFEAGVFARLELGLPAMALGDGLAVRAAFPWLTLARKHASSRLKAGSLLETALSATENGGILNDYSPEKWISVEKQVRLEEMMKTRREFLSVLRDYDTGDDFCRPDFLEELNHLADASFAKDTVEGYLAALLIYHQLCEELLRVLIKKSHLLLQCSVFPQRMEDRQLSKQMMFGELLREYERTLQLDESPELVKKCRQINKIRVDMVHKITLRSSVGSISKQARRCKALFDEIWQLFDTIVDALRDGIGDYKENIEDWEEWVQELGTVSG